MARKLKVFTTSASFFDLAVAAPSMKAALEAWGTGSDLFHHGFAPETRDAAIVEATMATPGDTRALLLSAVVAGLVDVVAAVYAWGMCGKFTAQARWREVVDFSQPLTGSEGGDNDGSGEDATYRVGGPVPVVIWDAEAGRRRVVPMRWGFPDPRDWRRPRPIHARSETIDAKEPFRTPFHAGQRGIVVFETFNEGEQVTKPSGRTEVKQWAVNPGDGQPRGFAFVWRRYEIADQPAPLLFCVMATVPASELIRRSIKPLEDEPRMPAILESFDVWATWLGEDGPMPSAAKALLRTMEGVNWTAAPEPKKPRTPRRT